MIKKIAKWVALLLVILLLGAGLWAALNWKHVRLFPSIISSFYAKEMCSCLFVLQRDEPFCHNYARQYVPIQNAQVDRQAKRVTVKGLWRTNSARFRGPRYGCTLEKLQ